MKHWKAIRQYLTSHTPHQGMQGVHNQVQSFEWSLICDPFFVVKLEFFQRIVSDCKYIVLFYVNTLRCRRGGVDLLVNALAAYQACPHSFMIPNFHMFLILCLLDVSSFAINLQGRRDASFFLCGEVCRFVSKLYARCYLPETIPLENSWFLILGFKVSEGKFITEEGFLTRFRLTTKIASASKQSAEMIHLNKKSEKVAIDKAAAETTSSFVKEGLQFIQYLVREVLSQAGLSSEVVKGLAAFDPFLLFKRPPEVGLRLFEVLYSFFQLRSGVTNADENIYRDEYLALLDHLRVNSPPDFDLMESSTDLIDFLMGLEFFLTHEHLLYFFKLCCLCVTSRCPQYPPVLFGSVDTTGYRSRFADLVVPCQSYLSCVPDFISCCCSDGNLEKFSILSASFERSAFSPDYDPWTYVDEFGRSKIYKSLLSSYKAVIAVPSARSVRMEKDTTSSVPDDSALKVPSKKQRKRAGSSSSTISSASKKAVQGSSKD